MSGVACELGLSLGLSSPSLVEAGRRWSRWRRADPILKGPDGIADLSGWLRSSEPAAADRVLRGLARVGSPRGFDDVTAVSAVAWALLPGARLLAHRLRAVGPAIDEHVASELWVQIRTFRWEQLGKVAANVLANTRASVLAEMPNGSRASRDMRPRLLLVDPHSSWWDHQATSVGTAPETVGGSEVASILADARSAGVLSSDDHRLLVTVLAQVALTGGGSACRGQAGLLADCVVDPVAVSVGASPATVRRRVRRSILAVRAAFRAGLGEAA